MTTPKKPAAPRKRSPSSAVMEKKMQEEAARMTMEAEADKRQVAKSKATTKPVTGSASTKPATKKPAAKKAPAKKPVAKKGKVTTSEPLPVVENDDLSPEEAAIAERFRRAVEIVNASTLPSRIKLFVIEYTKDMNGTQAAIRAGYAKNSANEQASQLLAKLSVKQLVDQIMNDRIEQGIFDGDAIIARWMDISTANPNALTQYRRCNCRYCWGADHKYQFTPREFEAREIDHLRDVTAALKEGKEPPRFDPLGGVGFWGTKDPHPECPECFGEGDGVPFFTDSRKLDRQSLALYAGVKQTKDGLEIQMHDQAAATDKLARHFGLYKDKLADAIEQNWTTEKLETLFAGSIAAAQAKARQIAEERRALSNDGETKD